MASRTAFLPVTLLLLLLLTVAATLPSNADARRQRGRRLVEAADFTTTQEHSPLERLRAYNLTASAGCGLENLLASYSQVELQGGCALMCDAYMTSSADDANHAAPPSSHHCNAYVRTADGSCLLYSECANITSNEANSTTVGITVATTHDDVGHSSSASGLRLRHSADAIYARFDSASCDDGDSSDLGTFPTDRVDCQAICNIFPGCIAYVESSEACRLHSSCSLVKAADGSVAGKNIRNRAAVSSNTTRNSLVSNNSSSPKLAAFTYLHRFHCSEDNIGQMMIPECEGTPEACTSQCAQLCTETADCGAFMLKYSGKCKFYSSCTLKPVSTPDYVGIMQQS